MFKQNQIQTTKPNTNKVLSLAILMSELMRCSAPAPPGESEAPTSHHVPNSSYKAPHNEHASLANFPGILSTETYREGIFAFCVIYVAYFWYRTYSCSKYSDQTINASFYEKLGDEV
jgi:hypothetical protein